MLALVPESLRLLLSQEHSQQKDEETTWICNPICPIPQEMTRFNAPTPQIVTETNRMHTFQLRGLMGMALTRQRLSGFLGHCRSHSTSDKQWHQIKDRHNAKPKGQQSWRSLGCFSELVRSMRHFDLNGCPLLFWRWSSFCKTW